VTATIPAFRALPRELQQAAGAAAALVLTLFLPWYSAVFKGDESRSFNRSAFGEFSFVEAAVLLVALGVLYLVWARSQRKAFHLPGGDGTVIMLAGGWACLLIVWRLFDTPEAPDAEFGLQWGIFVALAVAGALAAAGARVRAAHRPEPPNPAAEEAGWVRPPRARRRSDRRPRAATAVTEALRETPDWEGEPPEAPGPTRPGAPERRRERPGAATRRAEPPPDEAPPEQPEPPPDRLF
jgi:hypothetical protein